MLRYCPRDAFTLSTKVGRLFTAGRGAPESPPFIDALPFRPRYDYSSDGVMRSMEDSCQRLGMAAIDIVYIRDVAADHHGDAWKEHFATAMKRAAKALIKLREEGVIKGWGLGVNLTKPCERALEQSDPDIFLLAGRYSLLNQPALDSLFPACEVRGIRVVVGGPCNSGLLAGSRFCEYAEAPHEMAEKRDRIAAVCRRHGIDLRAAALQFCVAHPVVAAVIPGSKHAGKLRENTRLVAQPIPVDLWRELKAERLLPEGAPTPG